MTRFGSEEQHRIFDWVERDLSTQSRHLVVNAGAGTGKTTTIVEAINYAKEKDILLAAFNNRIAKEIRAKNTRADVKTLHSVGLDFVRMYWPGITWDFGKARSEDLTEQVVGPKAPDAVKALITKLHSKAREIAPYATRSGELLDLIDQFELHPDEEWLQLGFDADYIEKYALLAMDAAAAVKPIKTGIDGADMIFLPLRNKWLRKKWDMVIVDETQDLTLAQLDMGIGVCRGRIILVGDRNQAIYAFRGADSGSMDRLQRQLNADELKLSVTFRCGRAIVAEANRFVPDYYAGPDNPDGQVLESSYEDMLKDVGPGDFILSRVNAPLVPIAMKLLRAGKRTRVAGKDIGAGLLALIRKLKARTVPQFMERLQIWEDRQVEIAAATGKEKAVESVRDRAAMLREMVEDADSIENLQQRVEYLFVEEGSGDEGVITCSSVHKSKGLEANRVFILRDSLRDNNQEEKNIQYVAITRAKRTLVWVAGGVS